MDKELKAAIGIVVVGAGSVGAWAAWQFLEQHWQDIFALLVIALLVGVPLAIKVGKATFKVG